MEKLERFFWNGILLMLLQLLIGILVIGGISAEAGIILVGVSSTYPLMALLVYELQLIKTERVIPEKRMEEKQDK
jgi:hypothetical protein